VFVGGGWGWEKLLNFTQMNLDIWMERYGLHENCVEPVPANLVQCEWRYKTLFAFVKRRKCLLVTPYLKLYSFGTSFN
jgi:hypothetical protein